MVPTTRPPHFAASAGEIKPSRNARPEIARRYLRVHVCGYCGCCGYLSSHLARRRCYISSLSFTRVTRVIFTPTHAKVGMIPAIPAVLGIHVKTSGLARGYSSRRYPPNTRKYPHASVASRRGGRRHSHADPVERDLSMPVVVATSEVDLPLAVPGPAMRAEDVAQLNGEVGVRFRFLV